MATPTRKRKYEEVRWSLSRSSLAVRCTGVSAFRFPIVGVLSLVAISTTHCTVHMSDMSVALRLGSVGTCNVSVSREWTDTVGRSVDARGPVDLVSSPDPTYEREGLVTSGRYLGLHYILERNISPPITLQKKTGCSATPEILGYSSMMTQHFFGA